MRTRSPDGTYRLDVVVPKVVEVQRVETSVAAYSNLSGNSTLSFTGLDGYNHAVDCTIEPISHMASPEPLVAELEKLSNTIDVNVSHANHTCLGGDCCDIFKAMVEDDHMTCVPTNCAWFLTFLETYNEEELKATDEQMTAASPPSTSAGSLTIALAHRKRQRCT